MKVNHNSLTVSDGIEIAKAIVVCYKPLLLVITSLKFQIVIDVILMPLHYLFIVFYCVIPVLFIIRKNINI